MPGTPSPNCPQTTPAAPCSSRRAAWCARPRPALPGSPPKARKAAKSVNSKIPDHHPPVHRPKKTVQSPPMLLSCPLTGALLSTRRILPGAPQPLMQLEPPMKRSHIFTAGLLALGVTIGTAIPRLPFSIARAEGPAPAVAPLDTHDMSAELAGKIVAAAMVKSKEIKTKMDIAVVDAGGNLKAFIREDG